MTLLKLLLFYTYYFIETSGDYDKPSDITPVPQSIISETPTPKPRSVIATSPDQIQLESESIKKADECITKEEAEDLDTPVPKPRNQMKTSDSFKNLAALAEQSDSISLRSLDITDEISKTDEISTEMIRETSTSVTTEIEPSSEETERSADINDGKATKFYIGESSRNVIVKTTPTNDIQPADILLMQEASVDSDEANDSFKEYVTMKKEDSFGKLVRQNSETRNDLLEPESLKAVEAPLEKSEWEISEKGIPQGSSKVVHSPQEAEASRPKNLIDEDLVVRTLDEVEESLNAAKDELKSVVKDGKAIKESPSEFEFRTIGQTATITETAINKTQMQQNMQDVSSFIGIKENILDDYEQKQSSFNIEEAKPAFEESLNKAAVSAHYAATVHDALKDTSMQFASAATVEEISSMEDYYEENLKGNDDKKTEIIFEEVSSEQSIKPFDTVVHRLKSAEATSSEASQRWSAQDLDSSSSESYYKSAAQSDSRPLSSDVENLITQGNSSEYQTAIGGSTTFRACETTEYASAISTLNSAKSISSHESMRSLDSQSETSANLGSIDVSELSETLVASSMDADANDSEELARLRDLRSDDDEDEEDDSEDYAGLSKPVLTEQQMQQSMMKRSQEMIFKPKEEKQMETVTIEEFPKAKEAERTWGLAYPIDDDNIPKEDANEDILLYHGEVRKSIDDSKLASSLDDGSILSVSMSSTSNIETVVENFEDMIGSAASSLTGMEGFAFTHDDQVGSPQEDTFVLEIENKTQTPTELNASTPSEEIKKRGHKRNESTTVSGADIPIAAAADADLPVLGEGAKESESESDTDPYESEYARQFRSPSDRKSKKKKQDAAELERHLDTEKRPFTPSQLVAEIIVEDSITEELEEESILLEERRQSQNMQDYSNIPNITVTEDITQKSPISEEEYDQFHEKTLYKVKTQEQLNKVKDEPLHQQQQKEEENFQKLVQEQYKQKLAEIQKGHAGGYDDDDNRGADSPDSFEMVDQPDISDEFVIIEEVAKEANEVDLGGKSIKIAPVKLEQTHDEEVEKIIISSAPADPKLGSQIYKDDLNFEFEESPPNANKSDSETQEESDSGDMAAANKKWVEMQLTDSQLRYPYDLAGGVLEDIKEEDGEFEVGSSRISSFKDSFSSTPEYDVLAARRYFARGEHDDISMSSLQEFESLEQAISLENRNKTHQGSTDSSNGSFPRRYAVRHSASGNAPGDDVSVSSLKEFEGLENACIEAHLIEIKAKEEAALLSRSDESNKSNGKERETGTSPGSNVVVTRVTHTVTRKEIQAPEQQKNIEEFLKQKLEECEGRTVAMHKITELSASEKKLEKQDSDKGSVDSLEINKSLDARTSSIDSFDISKDGTTRSDLDSLEVDRKQPTREESIESMENEQLDLMSQFVSAGGTALDGLRTTTTTTTTTSTDAEGREHTVTRVITTTSVGGSSNMELPVEAMQKDISVDSLNMCAETTSSAGTTATYQTSAGNSQMSGSVTSCASSTLMEDSYPSTIMTASGSATAYWTHDEQETKTDDINAKKE